MSAWPLASVVSRAANVTACRQFEPRHSRSARRDRCRNRHICGVFRVDRLIAGGMRVDRVDHVLPFRLPYLACNAAQPAGAALAEIGAQTPAKSSAPSGIAPSGNRCGARPPRWCFGEKTLLHLISLRRFMACHVPSSKEAYGQSRKRRLSQAH